MNIFDSNTASSRETTEIFVLISSDFLSHFFIKIFFLLTPFSIRSFFFRLHSVLRVLLGQVGGEVHPAHLPLPRGHGRAPVRRVHFSLQLALPGPQLWGQFSHLNWASRSIILIIIEQGIQHAAICLQLAIPGPQLWGQFSHLNWASRSIIVIIIEQDIQHAAICLWLALPMRPNCEANSVI